MSNATFSQVFGPYIADAASLTDVQGAVVDQIELHRGSGWLHAGCCSVVLRPLKPSNRRNGGCQRSRSVFSGIPAVYPPGNPLLRTVSPPSFPFFDAAARRSTARFRTPTAQIEGETMTITLRHGGLNVLKATKTDAALGALIGELFGRRLSLVLNGEEKVDEQDEGYRRMMEAAEQEAAMRERARAEQMASMRPSSPASGAPAGPVEVPKPKKPADPSQPPADGLPIYLESAKALFGPIPRERPTPLRSLTDDGGNVTVWGEVFEYETRAFGTEPASDTPFP